MNIDTTNKLKKNVLNKISPKVLSPGSNANFFSDETKDIARYLFNLRNLYKYSVNILALKLSITKEEYKKFETGDKIPNTEISKLLISIYNLNPNTK